MDILLGLLNALRQRRKKGLRGRNLGPGKTILVLKSGTGMKVSWVGEEDCELPKRVVVRVEGNGHFRPPVTVPIPKGETGV